MSKIVLPDRMIEIGITTPGPPEVLQPRTVPLPVPARDELLVKVEAAGVNRPDVIQRMGHYPMPPGAHPTPGLEIAGEVVALGSDAQGFALGDRVCGLTNGGGYAEYCALPAGQALPIPDGVDAIRAAAIPETFFTVWANLFRIGRATPGERVLIHGGTSGIGTTALMLCREFGITAFATAGSEHKCAVVRHLGAEAINYHKENFALAILGKTEGHGVDVILDIMGGSYFERNLASLARDGRLVVIGFLGGTRAEVVDLQTLALKRATVTGSTMRARSPAEKAEIANDLRAHVWPVLTAGRCLPIVHEVFPLTRAVEAHRLMESGEHVGKIVLKVA
ncbi:NAD(P)H-quinone oxidoreductase [Dyella sp. BiH032]|uniref:NAD(P)H-quinone oxidoreductase n=1 Tax=Dyella sp. BiH032 TaxID=3075430 RepID=UPI00289364CD|nr:NAD(P)H-quinone oxidoreductase [Dyella sp. BiH032]WNL45234.1 NAD(P)H-quinone oxidoreductase [Dyella sp. BiH032]